MNSTKKSILLVEDDASFGMVLRSFLQLHNYDVLLCKDGMVGYSEYRKGSFDLVITDVMMPYKDGFTLAEDITAYEPQQPFLFLTAKGMKQDLVKGYELGAEDYLVKPFDSELLLLKIKTILKRTAREDNSILPTQFAIGKYHFLVTSQELILDKRRFNLSQKETALLQLLCVKMNEVLDRKEALKKIWKEDNYFTARSMDVYISKLRKHLQHDSSIEIINIQRKGHRLVVKE